MLDLYVPISIFCFDMWNNHWLEPGDLLHNCCAVGLWQGTWRCSAVWFTCLLNSSFLFINQSISDSLCVTMGLKWKRSKTSMKLPGDGLCALWVLEKYARSEVSKQLFHGPVPWDLPAPTFSCIPLKSSVYFCTVPSLCFKDLRRKSVFWQQ